MSFLERVSSIPKGYHVAIGLLVMAAIGGADYVTGFQLRMGLFYLVPISYVTWFVGQRIGILFSFLSLVMIVFSDIMAEKRYTEFGIEFWNGAKYFVFYVMVTALLKLRKTLQQRESLLAELDSALTMNEELGRLLPICANCNAVRDDDAYRQKVRSYIARHAKTTFGQGLCKECAAKLSPGKDAVEDNPSC